MVINGIGKHELSFVTTGPVSTTSGMQLIAIGETLALVNVITVQVSKVEGNVRTDITRNLALDESVDGIQVNLTSVTLRKGHAK